ncbi:hypothetical protein N9149_04675, partial [Akkermansiaceae bacterium]|nr:hypothetical protein [Akkermansiaceae bacterium]
AGREHQQEPQRKEGHAHSEMPRGGRSQNQQENSPYQKKTDSGKQNFPTCSFRKTDHRRSQYNSAEGVNIRTSGLSSIKDRMRFRIRALRYRLTALVASLKIRRNERRFVPLPTDPLTLRLPTNV